MKMSEQGKKALTMGSVCAIAYCAVYICRNILSALSPQLKESGVFNEDQLGTMSSVFFAVYATRCVVGLAIGCDLGAPLAGLLRTEKKHNQSVL